MKRTHTNLVLALCALTTTLTLGCDNSGTPSGNDLGALALKASMAFKATCSQTENLADPEHTKNATNSGGTFVAQFDSILAGTWFCTSTPVDTNFKSVKTQSIVKYGSTTVETIDFVAGTSSSSTPDAGTPDTKPTSTGGTTGTNTSTSTGLDGGAGNTGTTTSITTCVNTCAGDNTCINKCITTFTGTGGNSGTGGTSSSTGGTTTTSTGGSTGTGGTTTTNTTTSTSTGTGGSTGTTTITITTCINKCNGDNVCISDCVTQFLGTPDGGTAGNTGTGGSSATGGNSGTGGSTPPADGGTDTIVPTDTTPPIDTTPGIDTTPAPITYTGNLSVQIRDEVGALTEATFRIKCSDPVNPFDQTFTTVAGTALIIKDLHLCTYGYEIKKVGYVNAIGSINLSEMGKTKEFSSTLQKAGTLACGLGAVGDLIKEEDKVLSCSSTVRMIKATDFQYYGTGCAPTGVPAAELTVEFSAPSHLSQTATEIDPVSNGSTTVTWTRNKGTATQQVSSFIILVTGC